jgi:hypothetical protein
MKLDIDMKKIRNFFLDKRTKAQRDIIEDFNNNSKDHADIAGNLLKSLKTFESDTYIGGDVYLDIEFFKNFQGDNTSKTIFQTMDDFSLHGSRLFAEDVLSKPSKDPTLLEARHKALEKFENSWDKKDEELLRVLKNNEQHVLWIFEQQEKHVEDLFNILYFRFFAMRGLNKNPTALTCYNLYRILLSPMIGILSPIIYVIVPFFVLTWKLKIKIGFTDYVKFFLKTMFSSPDLFFASGNLKFIRMISYGFSILFYFQGMFNSIEISRTLNKICSYILNRFNGIVKYIKASQTLVEKYWNEDYIGSFVVDGKAFSDAPSESQYAKHLRDARYSLFSNFGRQLHDYKFLKKDIVTSLLLKTYVLDFVKTVTQYRKDNGYGYTQFVSSEKPHMNVVGLRHPCLDRSVVVKNDFDWRDKNTIITGPNAGGKSTFIKTILINVVMSQTICLSPCDECSMTPFKNIVSQINIPDCKGKESLFEAEMHRCQSNLNLLKNHPDDFTLIVMDEIFNSTNPVEGISGAFAIAKQIAKYPTCLLMFTTHYVYLTKLAKLTNRFKNYHMNVIIADETISFPYKLEKGYSRQYIALELLKKNGFDSDIIDEALEIKKRLTSS